MTTEPNPEVIGEPEEDDEQTPTTPEEEEAEERRDDLVEPPSVGEEGMGEDVVSRGPGENG